MYVCNCVTAVPAIGSPFPQRGKMKDEQTVTYHLYVATLPSWMSSSLASWAFRAQPRRRQLGRDGFR